jgi:hypothetical protein
MPTSCENPAYSFRIRVSDQEIIICDQYHLADFLKFGATWYIPTSKTIARRIPRRTPRNWAQRAFGEEGEEGSEEKKEKPGVRSL